MSDRYLSAAAAAAMSGRNVRTLRRWAAAGKLRTQRTESGHVTYLAADIERLADTTDTARPLVRLEESDAAALIRESQAQLVTLAHRVGELEGENRELRAALELERQRNGELQAALAPPTEPPAPAESPARPRRQWWQLWRR